MTLNKINKNMIDPNFVQEVQDTTNKIGNLSDLNTTNKTDIVKSVNEVTSQLADTVRKKEYAITIENQDLGLRKYRSAIAKVESGTNQTFNICFLGDSITEGVGSGTPIEYLSKGYTGIVRSKFNTKYGDVGRGMIPVYHPSGNPLWTFSAGWSDSSFGIASAAKSTSAIGETAQISFNGTGIVFIVYKGSNRGNVNVSIDGGAPTTLSLYNAANTQGTVQITGLTDGSHTAVITNAEAKTVILSGAYEIKGQKGFRINMVGKSGASTPTFLASDFTLAASIDIFSPVLTVIALITNDIGSNLNVETFKTNLQTIITRAKVYGDVLLVANNGRSDKIDDVQSPYVNAIADLAYSNTCAFVNIYKRWGLQGSVLGFMADTLHPNAPGHQDIANALLKVLIES